MSCIVNGCEKRVVSRGLCDMHRKRLARHGHLEQTRPGDWGKREKHPLYQRWLAIRRRCYDEKRKDYANYGARGIYMCEEWREDFWEFVKDVGTPPTDKHQLDRKDNDGPYSPDNCRWATAAEQARNKRNPVLNVKTAKVIRDYHSIGFTVAEISRALNIEYENVRNVVVGKTWRDI